MQLEDEEKRKFKFSYTIQTIEDTTADWNTRMDHYLKFGNEKIHYSAIILSCAIIATLILLICQLMKCGVNKDISKIWKGKVSSRQRRSDRIQ